MQEQILQLLRQHYPQIAEKGLQEEIGQIGQTFHYRAGEVIMDYGSYIKLMPLVIKGCIKVSRETENGQELFLYYLTNGSTCIMTFSCCMQSKKSQIRAVAEENTAFIGIPTQYLDPWMSQYQSWRNFVMQAYDNKFYELIQTIDNIAFKKMDERLINYLKNKSEATQNKVLYATHQEIAYDLNASREAISRLLKKLEKENQVQLGRNKIELL